MVCSLVLCGDCFRVALFPKFVFSFVCVVNSYLKGPKGSSISSLL